jgi:AmmeMemoRadiSam system protein B
VNLAIVTISVFLLFAETAQRQPVDPVGFPTTADQVRAVVEEGRKQAEQNLEQAGDAQLSRPMLAAVCPHDDHIYAGPIYLPVMERVKARHLILIGVFHKAWKWDVTNVLVFDDFESWRGPCGPIATDAGLRQALLAALPGDAAIVNDDYHRVEHSLEAFGGFIQYFDAGARIVPILIPSMNWERMDELAGLLAGALGKEIEKRGWRWGSDVQILISNDCVHYGDQGWGGKNYAPFGTGTEGLTRARQRDLTLIRQHLLGPIEPEKLEQFLYRLVDRDDVTRYLITWCGRFSVPFGLSLSYHLSKELGRPVPQGVLMSYGTSVELGELPLRETGLGVTAPANLHHWVGYAAVGYFEPAGGRGGLHGHGPE